ARERPGARLVVGGGALVEGAQGASVTAGGGGGGEHGAPGGPPPRPAPPPPPPPGGGGWPPEDRRGGGGRGGRGRPPPPPPPLPLSLGARGPDPERTSGVRGCPDTPRAQRRGAGRPSGDIVAHSWKSRPMSTARALWVTAPELMRSTPVSA